MQVQFLLRALTKQNQMQGGDTVSDKDKRAKAKEYYYDNMTYAEMSDILGVPVNTIRSWKKRDGDWKRKSADYKKQGAPKGNKNARGGAGGGAPTGNTNSERHAFYAKYLPPDMLEILEDVQKKSKLDIMEEQIDIQFTAILRGQKLMHVAYGEIVKEIISESETGTSYDIQYYWDRYDRYLTAQARAMGALNNTIRQYEEMLKHMEEQEELSAERRARIEKIKAETARIKDENENGKKSATINVVMQGEVSQYAE